MRWLLASLLVMFSIDALAINCEDIWTQAIRSNSAVPASIPFPASPNPSFPQPLEPIDYYYPTSGSYFIDNNTIRTTSGATSRVFVNGNLTIENNSVLNSGGPAENFILVVSGNLVLNNNVVINGFVLAGGAVQLNNNAQINGGLTAKGAVANFGATVNYRPAAIPLLNGGVVCDSVLPPAVLRAHYPLDQCTDETSSVLAELTGSFSGVGRNLTREDGVVNQGVGFAGNSDSRAELPAELLNGQRNFSLSLWFNTDTTTGLREIISASNNSVNNVFELYLTPDNTIRAAMQGSYHSFASSPPVLQVNTWYHLAFTRTGGNICLYLNASLVGCTSAAGGELAVNRVALGVWWQAANSFADFFSGKMDEVLLYQNSLTADEINDIYSFQLAGRNYDGNNRADACLSCLADDFNSGSLSDTWVAARSSGSFTPQIIEGRLRMTQAVANQATSATYQRLYPAANNLVIVEFDYFAWSVQGGTGADGLAVILSDANVTPQPGSFGGSLGYAQRNNGDPGFAGGWLGIALDEFGNFSAATEGRVGGPGRRQQSVAIRGAEAGNYRYLTGTPANISPRIDVRSSPSAAPGHRYRITVDSRIAGEAIVSVERDTGSGFSQVIAPFNALTFAGQSPVPENFFLSLTGSTGGSNNNHELDNISICALRSSPVGQQIDHFEFDHSGQALTCKPETITVRACANADCSQLITDPVTATLSPATSASGGWIGGNVINFAGGTTTVDLRRNTAGNTLVGVSGSVPNTRPLSQTLCRAGAGPLTTAACNISFASAGLVFNVPDGVANQPANNIIVSAVRQSDNSQQCVPSFADVSRNVGFWSSYINPGPAARPASLPLQVNGSDIGLTEGSLTPLVLNFNANGEAIINVNYADAGQVQLNARYSGSAANDDNGLVLNGSDQFIRRPAGFCIENAGHCLAADASCPVFKRAAEQFPLNISAHAWQEGSTDICANPVTPNFQQADISLSHSLVAPAGEPGTLGLLSYAHQRAVSGITTIEQSVSEVGIFRFNTAAVSYLSMADPIPAASGQPSGRFVPADFAVSDISSSAACGSFSYMQQPFSLGFTLTARNTLGQRTRNYFDVFANSTLLLQAENADDGIDLTGRLTSSGFGGWALGQQSFSTTELQLNRQASGAADGPFSELTVALNVIDADGSLVANPDTNVSNIACASDNSCNAAALLLTDIRYGRMQMANGFGPEFDDMPVNLTAEYWDGSRFLSNSADSCSVISAASLNLSNSLTSAVANTAALSAGKTPPDGLLLLAPDETGTVGATYQVPVWLQYDWNDDGSYTNSPVAEFMFGRYRGNPRQIYWRERF